MYVVGKSQICTLFENCIDENLISLYVCSSRDFEVCSSLKMILMDNNGTFERSGFVDLGGKGHCVLKWGFTLTFPGNQDATLQ